MQYHEGICASLLKGLFVWICGMDFGEKSFHCWNVEEFNFMGSDNGCHGLRFWIGCDQLAAFK